jgi:hypothetical protein
MAPLPSSPGYMPSQWDEWRKLLPTYPQPMMFTMEEDELTEVQMPQKISDDIKQLSALHYQAPEKKAK